MRAERARCGRSASSCSIDCGFHRAARVLPLDAEKKLVASRQSDRSRRTPAQTCRPQEVAIDGISSQLFIGVDVMFAHEAGVTGGEGASRS